MAYVCKELQNSNGVQTCVQWVEQTFVPTLSTADRDELLLYAISIFAVVFVVRQIMRLFN